MSKKIGELHVDLDVTEFVEQIHHEIKNEISKNKSEKELKLEELIAKLQSELEKAQTKLNLL